MEIHSLAPGLAPIFPSIMDSLPGYAFFERAQLCASLTDESLTGLDMNAARRGRGLWPGHGGLVFERIALHCQNLQTLFASCTACNKNNSASSV